MSKTSVKRLLSTLTREQLLEVVMELYAARKEAHDYLEYYADPDEEKMLEKGMALIDKEFLTGRRGRAKARATVCRKAVKEFDSLHPTARRRAELRLHLLERLVAYARSEYWWLRNSHVALLTWLMDDTLRLLHDSELLDELRPRLEAQAAIFRQPRNPRRDLLADAISSFDAAQAAAAPRLADDNTLTIW